MRITLTGPKTPDMYLGNMQDPDSGRIEESKRAFGNHTYIPADYSNFEVDEFWNGYRRS